MVGQLSGAVHVWELFDRKRTYGEVNLPFSEARELLMAVRYNALTGKGQQREIVPSHLKKIKAAMEDGSYTPAPGAAALGKKHRELLKVEDGRFSLNVSSDDPLPLTDAGHRFEAVERIVKDLEEKLTAEGLDAAEREKLERWRKQALGVPVTITLYFDGDAQRDFVNLQLGRTVDSAHMLSLKVQQKMLADGSFRGAFDAAKVLNKQEGSPFKNSIRFDSKGIAPLPISTLCSAGASDIGTSLVGLARAGAGLDAEKLAGAVVDAFQALVDQDAEHDEEIGLLEYGKVLTPLSNQGTKGSSTMLIGLGVCLAYRLSALGRDKATKEDLDRLVAAAVATLDKPVAGNFSGPVKRKLLGAFAREFLGDLPGENHHGLPVGLVKALSASTLGVEPLPKPKKEKAQKAPPVQKQASAKPKKARKKALPDVDGPLPAPAAPEVVVVTSEPVVVPAAVPAQAAPWEAPEVAASTGSAPWEHEIDG